MEESLVLKVEDLHVSFKHNDGFLPAVHGVNFNVHRGRTLGIVGESGSGKSVSSMSIMQLLPRKTARIDNGRILYYGTNQEPTDLLTLDEDAMQNMRGNHISMIFQEPMTSLNPVQKCGQQVVEMLRAHENVSYEEARQRTLNLFNEVMLPRPEKIFDSYPHEISGGQKQRVMITMALICNPDVLIADEPTTALDVTVQRNILELLRQLQRTHNIGIIFITHDLGVIAQIADEVAVLYQGKIVETGSVQQVLHQPQHPYTKGLLACRPPLDHRPLRLPTVKDYLSPDTDMSIFSQERSMPTPRNPQETPILQVRDLDVTYALRKNIFGKVLQELKAVDNLSFDLYRGETLGLVGESGCGKSTLGRTLLNLISKSAGTIVYKGTPLEKMSHAELQNLRLKMQIIFQDPYSSLNPRFTIGEAIKEPLTCHRLGGSETQRRKQVLELMERVGIPAEWYNRYPHELSGGQRQRVCIARALIMQPEVVVCDESVSALDVSVQAQVLNLLNDLKDHFGFTYIFITHDLSVVKFISDRIMVMERGRLVEIGTADEIYNNPQHPYTQKLIAALPRV